MEPRGVGMVADFRGTDRQRQRHGRKIGKLHSHISWTESAFSKTWNNIAFANTNYNGGKILRVRSTVLCIVYPMYIYD